MFECPRCYTKITADGNRLPPWCPKCGLELKAGTLQAAPAASGGAPLGHAAVKRIVEEVVGPDLSKGPPLSRTYRHRGCGGCTIVSGDDYVLLECPFRPVSGTFCAACNNFVPLEHVEWEDSRELISAYRQRVKASVGFWRGVYLAIFANAYQGAVNLRLDSRGRPLPQSTP